MHSLAKLSDEVKIRFPKRVFRDDSRQPRNKERSTKEMNDTAQTALFETISLCNDLPSVGQCLKEHKR